MIDRVVHPAEGENLETVLRHELARGDAMAEAARPVLRQLVTAGGSLPMTDEVVGRIRGMLDGIVRTLLDKFSEPRWADVEPLTRALIDAPALLSHLHALAIEWRIAEQLQVRLALDPVVSPLLEELVSRDDATLRNLAAKFLAAQARWCHLQRHMQVSLVDLPGELFEEVLRILRAQVARSGGGEVDARAEADLRKRYNEADRRLDLARQLVPTLEGGAQSALSISQAGVTLFFTALAVGSGLDRDTVVFSTDEAQLPRFALTLRSAGLGAAEIQRQLLALHPETVLPRGFGSLDSSLAAALLDPGHGGA